MSLGAWLCVFAAKLKARFAQDKENREFDDEVHAHLQLLTEQYLRQGMPAEQARLAARRQFGNPSLVRERHREARSFLSLSAIWRDVRFGALKMAVFAPIPSPREDTAITVNTRLPASCREKSAPRHLARKQPP